MQSWIESANKPECHFPIQNLPFGVANLASGTKNCVCAIGEFVVDLTVLEKHGFFCGVAKNPVFDQSALNTFMQLGPTAWQTVREILIDLLSSDGCCDLRKGADLRRQAVLPISDVEMLMPFQVAEFTDFYAGRHHAMNVGTMFRGPENALPPNWLHIPIGYNGRASSVVVSGTPVRRPLGQTKAPDAELPSFGPSRQLDIELEMAAVVAMPSKSGEPLSVAEADEMIFGYVLLNDWSARDIQAWEYQPLGPFQGKAFATTISPWVVTRAALEPFRISTPPREKPLLPYLNEPRPMSYDIDLEAHLQPAGSKTATRISKTNYNNLYYSAAQLLAHHASSGCKMNTGDLLGSGTISGPDKSQYGSLLEITWGGKNPFRLDNGEMRTFIEDGDKLTLTGWSQGDGYRIGFGTCEGTVVAAPAYRD